jgi:hypothetical protein
VLGQIERILVCRTDREIFDALPTRFSSSCSLQPENSTFLSLLDVAAQVFLVHWPQSPSRDSHSVHAPRISSEPDQAVSDDRIHVALSAKSEKGRGTYLSNLESPEPDYLGRSANAQVFPPSDIRIASR